MTAEQMVQYAYEEGFSAAAVVDTADIVFDPSFRPYCEENLCGQYGANHSCPPDCGTPEEMKQKILAHKKALVLQSIWQLESYTDTPAIKKGKSGHNTSRWRPPESRRTRRHGHASSGGSRRCCGRIFPS